MVFIIRFIEFFTADPSVIEQCFYYVMEIMPHQQVEQIQPHTANRQKERFLAAVGHTIPGILQCIFRENAIVIDFFFMICLPPWVEPGLGVILAGFYQHIFQFV